MRIVLESQRAGAAPERVSMFSWENFIQQANEAIYFYLLAWDECAQGKAMRSVAGGGMRAGHRLILRNNFWFEIKRSILSQRLMLINSKFS